MSDRYVNVTNRERIQGNTLVDPDITETYIKDILLAIVAFCW